MYERIGCPAAGKFDGLKLVLVRRPRPLKDDVLAVGSDDRFASPGLVEFPNRCIGTVVEVHSTHGIVQAKEFDLIALFAGEALVFQLHVKRAIAERHEQISPVRRFRGIGIPFRECGECRRWCSHKQHGERKRGQ